MQPEHYENLKWLLLRLQNAEQYCQEYFERGKRWYRLWRFGSAVDEGDWPYVNRVRTKDIFAFCEDTTALMMSTLLATMPFYSIIPRETSIFMKMFTGIDPTKVGNQLERCLAYQVEHEDTEFFEEITDFIKNGTIMGNSYMGVYPKFIGGPPPPKGNGRYLRPLLRGHDFWDILPIPRGSRLTRIKGVFIREFNTDEDLEELQRMGVYQNVDQLTSDVKAGMNTEWHKELLQELGMEDYITDEENKEILHYFSGGHVKTIADRKVILRDSMSGTKPFPYDLPLVQYKYIPIPYEFFSMGIPEVLEVLQEDRNLIRSARRDNIDMIINKILKVKMGSDINLDLIKSYPNAIWPVTEDNDITEMPMTDVSGSAYNEEQLISRDQENAMSLFGYARGMTPSHCVDDQTEILTDEGWKFFKDLNKKEKVLTINLNTKKYEWKRPSGYIDQDYEGWMICGKNENINFKVSPNHKMIVQNQKKECRLAGFSEIRAGDRIPRTFDWDGTKLEHILSLPNIGKVGMTIWRDNYTVDNFPLKEWVQFVGIFIAEGHARGSSKIGYTIEIAQTDEKKKNKIRRLLNKLFVKFKERGNGFYIYDKELCLWLMDEIGKKENKRIPKPLKELSPQYLKELFDWMMLGDGTEGSTKLRGKEYPRRTYTTNSKKLADDVQEIVLKMGKNATIHYRSGREIYDKTQDKTYKCKPEYDITILNSKTTNGFKSKIHYYTWEWYKGKIYCIEENENKTMVTRRNGQTFPTGRSEQPTTVMKLQQASLNRIDLSVKLAEFGFFQKIGARIIQLTRRFMRQEDYEEIIGEPDAGFFRLNEDQIRWFYYVKPVGSSITHIKELKQQHIQFAIQLLGALQQNPMAQQQFGVNWYKAAKIALEASDVPDANEILIPTQQQTSPLGQMQMPNPALLEALQGVPYGQGGM